MLVGSNAFFKNIEGFKSKDIDVLELIDNPIGFKNCRWIKFPSKCVFQWRRMPLDEFINVTLANGFPMEVGKFLVPEFIKEYGLSIEDLKRLQPLIDKLDDKHIYEKYIYDSYIRNNSFVISNEDLLNSYEIYKLYRK